MTTPAEASPRKLPLGRIAAGVLLLLLGAGWLLETTDVIDVDWGAVLPAALIVVGLALLAGSRTGAHGVLVTVGVVLTVILTAASSLNVPLSGGVGERVHRPGASVEVRASYELGIGDLTLDLTGMPERELGEREITVSLGIGHLRVLVPGCAEGEVRGSVTLGEFQVGDVAPGGIGVDDTVPLSPDCPTPEASLTLDLSVGIGQIEVQQ